MKTLLSLVAGVILLASTGFPVYASNYLVYDTGDGSTQAAMDLLGLPYDVRSVSNPVTLSDLQTHNVLIVDWNNINQFQTGGLDPAILHAGITGNIVLTGHDPAIHYVGGTASAGAFLRNAITFAENGNGTGIVAAADMFSNFSYLPASWGITSLNISDRNGITQITAAGRASGSGRQNCQSFQICFTFSIFLATISMFGNTENSTMEHTTWLLSMEEQPCPYRLRSYCSVPVSLVLQQ